MRWVVSGRTGRGARVVSRVDGRPIFGGTPADASVLQAIARIKASGHVGDVLSVHPDGHPGRQRAAPIPGPAPPTSRRCRGAGRITLAKAPGRPGSTDKTAAAADEVAAFFGQAPRRRFPAVGADRRAIDGPAEWSYRRFVAALCASLRAGGRGRRVLHRVGDARPDADPRLGRRLSGGAGALRRWPRRFGRSWGRAPRSAMRRTGRSTSGTSRPTGRATCSTTSIRSGRRRRSISSASTTTCRCRTGATAPSHADAGGGIDLRPRLPEGQRRRRRGVSTGTMPTPPGATAQERLPITDGAYGEDWVFRYKDLVSWWSKPHVEPPGRREGGGGRRRGSRGRSRSGSPSSAARRSNKGTNQPNVFHDPKSSESFFPYYSDGSRDDFIQYRYLQAMFAHWNDPANNPVSDVYGGRMVDMCSGPRLGVGRAAMAGLSRTARDLGRRQQLRAAATG